MSDQKEKEMIKKLYQDWANLDQLAQQNVPSQLQIKEQLNACKVNQKKIFYKELALFIITALFILSVFVFIAFQSPLLFITIEVIAMFVIPLLYVIYHKKSQQKGEIL